MSPLKWTPETVKAAAIQELVANGEIVGKFVESDARRRLLAIRDPDWGANYRRLVVGRLLTNVVEKSPNEVTITVGVRTGPRGAHHGFFIEFGSRTAGAHPFLRPAVFENGRQIVALLSGG